MDNDLFKRDPFNWRNAWEWLIENATFAPVNGLARGQLKVTMRGLAKAWNWEEPRVRRFLAAAQKEGMIHVLCRRTSDALHDAPADAPRDSVADAPWTVVTICNYERYQANGRVADAPADAPRDAPADAYREAEATHSINKKEAYKKEEDSPPIVPPIPTPPRRQRKPKPDMADWKPNEDHYLRAASHGYGRAWVDDQAESYRDWNSNAKKHSDFDAGFRNWLKKNGTGSYADSRKASQPLQLEPFDSNSKEPWW